MATCIPSLGPDAPLPPKARLGRPAEVTERYGIVWVALEPPRAPIIAWPDGDDPALGEFSPTAHISEVLAGYQTDNLLDASHFPFLHGSLVTREPKMDRYEVVHESEFEFATWVRYRLAGDPEPLGTLNYTCTLPYSVILRNQKPDGSLRRSFFQAIQPIDEHRTRLFFIVRGHETDPDVLEKDREVEEIVQQEDLWMTAALRRTELSLDDGIDLHVRADKNGIIYRRLLRGLINPNNSGPISEPQEAE